jgi:hypothetical protein
MLWYVAKYFLPRPIVLRGDYDVVNSQLAGLGLEQAQDDVDCGRLPGT